VVHNTSEFPEASHNVISNSSLPADPYSYPQLLLIPPTISDEMGLPRLYFVIRSIHERIDPDFAFFVNDHTFVIPEHLCHYLNGKNPAQDLYAGHALKNDNLVFNSGAAGYVLSRATMSKIVAKLDSRDPECSFDSSTTGKWIQNNPGIASARCIKSFGVQPIDTRSQNKWHRFHAFPITRVVSGRVDEWYHDKHVGVHNLMGLEAQDDASSYDTLLSGDECCSKSTVSFHYVESHETRALFATREALLENPAMSDHELKIVMTREWPQEKAHIGFYSHGLPKKDDEKGWNSLLAAVRKISTRKTQSEC
jgi:hypothetical protein